MIINILYMYIVLTLRVIYSSGNTSLKMTVIAGRNMLEATLFIIQ